MPSERRHRAPGGALLAWLLLASAAAGAFSEGGPWEAAEGAAGCAQCHFGTAPVPDSSAIAIEGLPARIGPGQTYRFLVRLADRDMAVGGFLLAARQGRAPIGRFRPADERSEARDALARSTRHGTALTGPGRAEWTLEWQAPDRLAGAVRFEVWANASDDDRSPLGDVVHHRTWEVPAAPR